jgi:predicted transcriptional regulator
VDGIPVISLREVKEMESPREFIENMEERRD